MALVLLLGDRSAPPTLLTSAAVVAREIPEAERVPPLIYRGPEPAKGPRPRHTLRRVDATEMDGVASAERQGQEDKLQAHKMKEKKHHKNNSKSKQKMEQEEPTVASGSSSSSVRGGADEGPDGKYCGSFSVGLIKGFVLAKKEKSTFDIHLEGMNQNLTCTDEEYVYDSETHHADVPGTRDPEDCLGEPLTHAKVTLDVVYAPEEDVVTLDFGFTHVDCKKCE